MVESEAQPANNTSGESNSGSGISDVESSESQTMDEILDSNSLGGSAFGHSNRESPAHSIELDFHEFLNVPEEA